MTPFEPDFESDADLRLLLRPSPGSTVPRVSDAGDQLAAAGHDTEAILDAIADACAAVPADLVVVILNDAASGRLTPVAVRHADPAGAARLRERLIGPGRGIDRLTGAAPSIDAAVAVALPVDAEALPESVRAVLADEDAGSVVVAPVAGQLGVLGVAVLARRAGAAPFADADADVALAVTRRGGVALEVATLSAGARRQTALIDLLADAVIAVDPHELVTTWSPAAERTYGIPAADAIGVKLADLLHTTYLDGDTTAARRDVLANGSWRGRVRQQLPSGRQVEIDSRVSVVRDGEGRLQGYVAVNRDLSELIAARASAELHSRFAQELMDALDGRGAVLDRSGKVIAANARWRVALADRERCACGPVAEGESWVDALRNGESQAAALGADVAALLSGGRSSVQAECHCAGTGPDRATAIEVARVDAGEGGAIVVQSDVSWRRRLQDELSYRATHDELTELPNRAALMEGLSGSLTRLDGSRKLAVLFCDLDGFKDINDGLGHAVGDQVLVAVARRLRQRCRSADVVARFGGDEFVVVLSITEVAQAVAMADRIVEVLAEPIVVGDAEVAPGVSVGITVVDVPPSGDDPVGTLLRDADTAMYHAKGRGRGRYEFFDASLRENIAERLELAAALHRAVTDDELTIVYQTRRYCGDRRVAGVEALLQWRHPVLGRIDPEVFIPIAERTGRIVEVGAWVLRRALCEFAQVGDPRLSLAVNVSPRQLTSRLAATVAAALEESALDPWRLTLEITESALVDDPAAARAVLTDLRSLGVTIALDDFGTGWSSLSYLRTLPVDVLKIDRSFVADLPHNLDACAVVSAVLGLGHGMGLVVVAEGVEHEDHLATLRDMGCDEYQGFLDGRPGPLAEVLGAAALTPS